MGQMCAAHGIAIAWTSHGVYYLIFLIVLSEIKDVFLNKTERHQTQ